SGGTWGPVSYVYGIFAIITNPNVIVAKQVDSSGNALVANSTGLINVQRHPTALVFRTVQDSVVAGTGVSAQGVLIDNITKQPVPQATIDFTGNGAAGLGSATTSGITVTDSGGVDIV